MGYYVMGYTRDINNNEKEWRMSALPDSCDDEMVVRRLSKRHFACFDTAPTHISWEWRYDEEEEN